MTQHSGRGARLWRYTPWALMLPALAWSAPDAGPVTSAPPARAAATQPAAQAAAADAEAQPVAEGIWTWVDRFEGEVVPAQAQEALDALDDARLAEVAVFGGVGGLDVPLDVYDDPAAALTGDALHLDLLDPTEFSLPIVLDPSVVEWMEYLLGPGRRTFTIWLQRKATYEDLIYAELDSAGAPRDLIYLSMIESGFVSRAESYAGAGGLWQFIPTTAKAYGLKIDWWVDERRDPAMATEAATKMLGELERMFDDWHLAMAAYNTGPSRVRRQLQRNGLSSYWDLRAGDHLHKETMGYVPKILAAMIIGHHPERYGFTDLELGEPLVYETVEVQGSVDIEALAACAEITPDAFAMLNPQLRRAATPDGTARIHLPLGTTDAFLAAFADLPPEARRQLVEHKVRSGESLSVIAERYDVTVSSLMSANSLRSANRIAIGQVLTVPVRGGAGVGVAADAVARRVDDSGEASGAPVRASRPSAVASSAPVQGSGKVNVPGSTASPSSSSSASSSSPARTYTVRSGDSLSEIGERFGVSVRNLQRWNGISGTGIQVGQRLKVSSSGSSSQASSGAGANTTKVIYAVRSGDTLSEIAQAHSVSLSDLLSWNRLRSSSRLSIGQKLTIHAPVAGWMTISVRSGDSLGLLAQRYKCSISEIQAWNSLSGTTIHPGQKLKLRRR